MIRLPQHESKVMVALHGWSGALLGLLLYAVIVTGTAAVFAAEIRSWSAGEVGSQDTLSRPLDAIARQLKAKTPEKYDDLNISGRPGGNVLMFFHQHEQKNGEVKEYGVLYEVAPNGQVASQREGWSEDLFHSISASALGDFFVELHVRLHLPKPWGLILTGILGCAMLLAAVSGLLIHRHLLTDIFTLRRGKERLVAARDTHTVAATWTLPHAFVLSFTGAFFSFAIAFGFPLLATVAFNGDQMAMFETLVGKKAASDPSPANLANIDRMIEDARTRGQARVTFVVIDHFGRADANVTISLAPRDGHISGANLIYNGATGAFDREKPGLGTVPSFGSQLFALMGPLHFGTFAGWTSKAVWFALGAATAFVTLSGMRLWIRRRAESAGWRALGGATSYIGGGLPFALTASAWGYFCGLSSDSAIAWTAYGFLIAAGVALLPVLLLAADRACRILFQVTGVMLLALPLLRLATGGPGWGRAIDAGQYAIPALDFLVVLGGVLCLMPLIVALRSPREIARRETQEQPAE